MDATSSLRSFCSGILIFCIFLLSAVPALALEAEGDIPSEGEIEEARLQVERDFSRVERKAFVNESEVLNRYSYLDRKKEVPQVLLRKAILYFDANKAAFRNQRYISIVDFSKRSNLPRFFLINMNDGTVASLRTTHGSGSDRENDGYAESFGNLSGSNKSSLGFYKVAEDYHGRFGHSIRLDGLSSTNSNARARAVVVHGYDYAWEKNVIQGLSWGCIAVAWEVRDMVLERLKGGSLLYAGLSLPH